MTQAQIQPRQEGFLSRKDHSPGWRGGASPVQSMHQLLALAQVVLRMRITPKGLILQYMPVAESSSFPCEPLSALETAD